jgi:uncharacterized membrane protein
MTRWMGSSDTLAFVNVLQRLRERFWFIPTVLCVVALVAAELLVAVDERVDELALPAPIAAVLYRVGDSGSRDLLGAIATSSLAVAGTTFSITMAVLALTSSSYGPRLVRNFMADRGNQTVLGVYVSTFLYCILVLRSIRVLGDRGATDPVTFVPHLAVNGGLLLAVLDVAVLVYFIHHVTDSIQVSTLAGGVRRDLLAVVDRLYPAGTGRDTGVGGGRSSAVLDDVRRSGTPIRAGRAGYVQDVREDAVLKTARRRDLLVDVRCRPGQYVLPDTVVLLAYPPARVGHRAEVSLRSAIGIAEARTPTQDVGFAVQQLTEMAVRALSPGTNDPFTAVNALNDLATGLAALVAREMPCPWRSDRDGTARVHAPRPEQVDLVGGVLDHVRWYAAGAPAVMHAGFELAARVAEHARSDTVLRHLEEHVDLLQDAFGAAGHHVEDLRRFADHADQVRLTTRRSVDRSR